LFIQILLLTILSRLPADRLFNILVYTRPHVKKFRQRNPSVSYMAAFKKVVSSGGDCDEDETLRNRFRRGSAAVPRRASMSSRSSSSGGKRFLAPPFFADGFNAYRQKFRNSARRSSVAFNFDVSSQDPSTLKIPADHDLALCIDGEKDPVTADGKVIDSSLALEARPSLADEQQQFSASQNLDLEAIVALHGASADKKQVEEKGDSVLGALDEVDSELEARPSLADEQQQFSGSEDLDLEAIGELHGASAEKKQVKEKGDSVMVALDEVDSEVEARPSLADEQQQVSAPQDLDLEAIGELHGASAEKKQVKEKADGVMGGLDEADLESRS
jgi:hypothetical protein